MTSPLEMDMEEKNENHQDEIHGIHVIDTRCGADW